MKRRSGWSSLGRHGEAAVLFAWRDLFRLARGGWSGRGPHRELTSGAGGRTGILRVARPRYPGTQRQRPVPRARDGPAAAVG